jgi:hypothetical protein
VVARLIDWRLKVREEFRLHGNVTE